MKGMELMRSSEVFMTFINFMFQALAQNSIEGLSLERSP